MPRQRRKIPAIKRIRTWTWYAALKKRAKDITELNSDNKLDEEIVRYSPRGRISQNRLRVFTRIRRYATDPVDLQVGHKRFNLVDWVEIAKGRDGKLNGVPGPKAIHDSELWSLLTGRRLNLQDLSDLIALLAARRNLFRADLVSALVAKKSRWRKEPFRQGVTVDYKSTLRAQSKTGDIDAVAFLSALFLEATATHCFEQAIFLRQMLQLALRRFFENNEIPIHLANLIADMVAVCVLMPPDERASRISLPPGWSPYKFGQRPQDHDFTRGFLELRGSIGRYYGSTFPWVPIDKTIKLYQHTLSVINPKALEAMLEDHIQEEFEQMLLRGAILHTFDAAEDDVSIVEVQNYAPLFFTFPWQSAPPI